MSASVDTAESICVMNTVTGDVVFEKNAYERKPMASTTKIMTLVTALKNSEPDDVVRVGHNAVAEEGSSAYLKPDATITMRDLWYGLMLNSGNDAAVAIAEHISGDVDSFAKLMNETAQMIGVKDTHFVNPNGLHDDEHFTTAFDLAVITRYAMRDTRFSEIVSTKMYTSEMILSDGTAYNVEYINHNRLLNSLDGCVGVKTGFTKDAGRCLVSAIDIDGAKYIAVTLNDSDDWNTHKELYQSVIKTARERVIVRKGDCMMHIGDFRLVAQDEFCVFVNDTGSEFEIVKNIPKTIDFPLNRGEKVGYLSIELNGNVIGVIDVVSDGDYMPDNNGKTKNCFMFTLINLLRNTL